MHLRVCVCVYVWVGVFMYVCMHAASSDQACTVSHGGASRAELWTLTDTSVLLWPTASLSGATQCKTPPVKLIC